jgi:hypothetical protein
VKAVAVWDLLFGDLDGQPGALLFGADDEQFMGAVGRPVVVSGRTWDPTAPDEVVIDENASKSVSEECGRSLRSGCAITVGSTFVFQPYGLDQGMVSDASVRPDGPQITMKVVGVVRTINQFLFVPDGSIGEHRRRRRPRAPSHRHDALADGHGDDVVPRAHGDGRRRRRRRRRSDRVAVVLVVPVTVFVVNALAVWPGRHVARVRPAELLHVE